MAEWQISPLSKAHDRSDFSCGKPDLDRFLLELSSQYDKKDYARTFVLTRSDSPVVLGYFTLSASLISLEVLPGETRRRLPKHPAPVAQIGRLAVDLSVRGERLGEKLLVEALRLIEQAGVTLAVCAVEVVALDEAAKGFYLKYGFAELLDDPLHLYLPTKSVRKMLAAVTP